MHVFTLYQMITERTTSSLWLGEGAWERSFIASADGIYHPPLFGPFPCYCLTQLPDCGTLCQGSLGIKQSLVTAGKRTWLAGQLENRTYYLRYFEVEELHPPPPTWTIIPWGCLAVTQILGQALHNTNTATPLQKCAKATEGRWETARADRCRRWAFFPMCSAKAEQPYLEQGSAGLSTSVNRVEEGVGL